MKLTIFLLLISLSCRAQVKENYKDSANKYWKIAISFADSTAEHKRLGNKSLEKYFYRKEKEARVKSAKYVENF